MRCDLRQHSQGLKTPCPRLWARICGKLEIKFPPCILIDDEIPAHPQIKWDIDEQRDGGCEHQPQILDCGLPSESDFVSVNPTPVLADS